MHISINKTFILLQLRQELGGIKRAPSFVIVSFLGKQSKKITVYEGSAEIGHALANDKLEEEFEECIKKTCTS